jgi:hypothetical protein
LNSNLPLKLGLINKILLIGFPNHLLENNWVGFTFPYALLPFHEGVDQDTIGVNTKQPIIRVLCNLILWKTKCRLYITLENKMDVVV